MIFLYAIFYLIFLVTAIITKQSIMASIFGFMCLTWLCSFISVFRGLIGLNQRRKSRRCTEHTVGEYRAYYQGDKNNPTDYHEFTYVTKDGEITGLVDTDYTEDVNIKSVGELYDIWYNPNKPKEYIVSKDGTLAKKNVDYMKSGKWGLVVFIGCNLYFVSGLIWILTRI